MKIEVERRTNTKELVLEDDFEADRIRPLYRDYFEVWGGRIGFSRKRGLDSFSLEKVAYF